MPIFELPAPVTVTTGSQAKKHIVQTMLTEHSYIWTADATRWKPSRAYLRPTTKKTALAVRISRQFGLPWMYGERLYLEGQERLELSTPCLRGRCSNQLSYWPV